MKIVYDKLDAFEVVGVKPGPFAEDSFQPLTDQDFAGQWKVIVFYPKDFTFVCPTEIIEYDKLLPEFESRNTVLLTGSTDNEFVKLAWRDNHPELAKIKHWQFADVKRNELSLSGQLGIFFEGAGAALRATYIVNPDNEIQHMTINNLDTGRNAQETLRVLDALQTGELTACGREIGGDTL